MKHKVSVIVPVYKVEQYLDRCVQSIRNQTLQDIEIILVDDGSPDKCPDMCDEYARMDSRIKVVHKQNAGLGMACNSGIEAATGEYIAFCDSDDWVDENMYESMYLVAKDANADVIYTGLKRVNGEWKQLSKLPHPKDTRIYREGEIYNLLCDFICSDPSRRYDHEIQVSAKVALYKKEIIDRYSLRFVSERTFPSEDLIFNVSLLSVATIAIVDNRYFYNYFVNDSSITTTLKEDRFEKIIDSTNLINEIILNGINKGDNSLHSARIARFLIGEARTYAHLISDARCPVTNKKRLMKELSSNQSLRKAAGCYPMNQMPLKHLIATKLILTGNYYLVNLLFRFA